MFDRITFLGGLIHMVKTIIIAAGWIAIFGSFVLGDGPSLAVGLAWIGLCYGIMLITGDD